MKFCFGDIVVVHKDQIGVVVKSWRSLTSPPTTRHDVYVRSRNCIESFNESEMERYMVRHKRLNEEELEYQHNATHA